VSANYSHTPASPPASDGVQRQTARLPCFKAAKIQNPKSSNILPHLPLFPSEVFRIVGLWRSDNGGRSTPFRKAAKPSSGILLRGEKYHMISRINGLGGCIERQSSAWQIKEHVRVPEPRPSERLFKAEAPTHGGHLSDRPLADNAVPHRLFVPRPSAPDGRPNCGGIMRHVGVHLEYGEPHPSFQLVVPPPRTHLTLSAEV
jgi:hypothetical protein